MSFWFILPALALMGGLVAFTSLGSQVLKRGVVFVDLAVAQAAAAAVIWVNFTFDFESTLIDQTAATVGAVLISLTVSWITHQWQQHREALIGLIYVAGACAALLGASLHPHGRDKLFQLLAADVLWVTPSSVITLAISALAVLAVQLKNGFSKDFFFYALFAVVTSLAVPALGLFLVFASLIAPALWIEKGWSHWLATGVATAVSWVGLWGSWLLDTPSGPTIAMALSLLGLTSLFVTRAKPSPA